MNGRKDWTFGVLISIALGVSAWSLKWTFEANTRLALIQQTVDRLATDTKQDEAQTATLTKHWRYLGWSRDRINELRTQQGQGIVSWPE